MATHKFSSELSSRGTVKTTDKLIIQNIDTGAVEYCTVGELLAAFSISAIAGNIVQIRRSSSDRNTLTRPLIVDNYSENNPYTGFGTGLLFKLVTYNPIESVNAAAIDAVMETYDTGPIFSSGLRFYVVPSYAAGLTEAMRINGDGSVSVGTTGSTSKFQVAGLPQYNDNANAVASGLAAGAFYRTGDTLKVVHS